MSARGESENSGRIDWNIYRDCKGCGAAEGKQCFSSNGSRKRFPCASRAFTEDGVQAKFEEAEKNLAAISEDLEAIRSLVYRQQKQIDLLLGEVGE